MRRRPLRPVVLLPPAILALSVSCASVSDESQDTGGAAGADESSDEDVGGGSFDSGAVEDAEASFAWWRLDADLSVAGGDLAPSGAALEAALLDESGAELCRVQGAPVVVTPFLTLPDELLIAWWSVDEIAWSGDCLAEGADGLLPTTLSLGVGTLHPEIVAVVDSMPEATGEVTASLNGAYAQFDEDGTIYVFGAIGPSAAWEGAGEAAQEAPLSDGVWELRGAYGFPL